MAVHGLGQPEPRADPTPEKVPNELVGSDVGEHRHEEGIRIARIATVPYFLATQLAAQIRYLHGQGMQITLISGPGPELAQLRRCPGLKHETVALSRAPELWTDAATLLRLYRIFRRGRFDIVHSTTPKAGLLCALAGFAARVPIRLHTFTGQPWVNLSGFIRWFARMSDWLIGTVNTKCYADSQSQRQYLIDQGIVSAERISVIGEGSLAGVDLDRFNSQRWTESEKRELRISLGLSEGSKVITFVGRITPDKGIHELLVAFDGLARLGHSIHLLLIGPLDQERGGVGGITVKELLVNSLVRYIGYTDCPEQYLAISDVLCLPSYREGFGTVVIEAAAMGVPTIGTDIYGLSDAVVDGETGMLVPVKDSSALMGALKKFFESPELALRMSASAKRRCESLFDSRRVNQLVFEEYLAHRSGKHVP